MRRQVFLNRVVLQNYKSIRHADVQLGSLTFLVGPNGVGKSNFLDALRLTSEALRGGLDNALLARNGINEVRRRSAGHPTHFGVRLEFTLPSGAEGYYAFRVGAQSSGGFIVSLETCSVCPAKGSLLSSAAGFSVKDGKVVEQTPHVPLPASSDRLYLANAAGFPEFRELYDMLTNMGFYNLSPEAIREPRQADPNRVLRRDGANLASILRQLSDEARDEVMRFLAGIVPGIIGVTARQLGNREALEVRQRLAGSKEPWRFMAENMSDGTLRALGVLVALFQDAAPPGAMPLVAIEEPETAIHPGAAAIMFDAIRTASTRTQVLVTSHSPDLLDRKELTESELLGVSAHDGVSEIGRLSDISKSVLHDRLFTAGELLRQGQLQPQPSPKPHRPRQEELFTTTTT